MNILLMTNTYKPHKGGVARSIEQFSQQYQDFGHRVLIVAPEFDNMEAGENNVIRVPAIRSFNHTDFSLSVPMPYSFDEYLTEFNPDIIHSHHPFLLGSAALRISHALEIPIIFTHHTKYEDYIHNVSMDSELVRQFARNMATNYANTCDQVFAPSQSMRDELVIRGVTTRIDVVPTGVEVDIYKKGDGVKVRQELGIPSNAYIVGHLGRLTKEKNIQFLTKSVIKFIQTAKVDNAFFVVFGEGDESTHIQDQFMRADLENKLVLGGPLEKSSVPDAYHCMDVFAFASQSETQGMVLTEAMASGVPVVAVDASGVREVLKDKINGRLIQEQSHEQFTKALLWVYEQDKEKLSVIKKNATATATEFSMSRTAEMALGHYQRLVQNTMQNRPTEFSEFSKAMHAFEAEWRIIKNTLRAATDAALAENQD